MSIYLFYAPLHVIINLLKIHFISDLAAYNVNFKSRKLLTPPVAFILGCVFYNFLLADFHLPFFCN